MRKFPDNIVFGSPPKVEGSPDVAWEEWLPVLGVEASEHTVFETTINTQTGKLDLHLPRALVRHGFAKSTSVIRKAIVAKDQLPLVRDLDKPEFTRIKIAHKHVWIIVGDLS